MHRELNEKQLAFRNRMLTATIGENGRRFHPEAPEHGTATAVTYWGCRCEPCEECMRESNRKAYQRKKFNSLILMRMRAQQGSSDPSSVEAAEVADLPSAPADESAAAPLSLMEEFAERYKQLYWKASS